MRRISILNWRSRRATEPVAAAIASFTAAHPEYAVTQTVRPLSDFEHQGIDTAADEHDIVVFDHPFCGDIADSRCFLPLETLIPELAAPEAGAGYIGPSLATYRYGGHLWGMPIDGATQHALYRADLLQRLAAPVPCSHADVLALGQAARRAGLYLGTAVHTPHALMSILSHMANLGAPIEADEHRLLAIPRHSFHAAYEAVREVLALAPAEAMHWNSIDLHEAMVDRDDIVYAPLVYGYATYGEPDHRRRLSFAGYAGLAAPYHAGTAIGGTAMGISRHSRDPEAAAAFVRHMADPRQQDRSVAEHHGQPAGIGGWRQPDIDARYNGFFSSVAQTMDACWIRPRYKGYIRFQQRGGMTIADALRQGRSASEAYREILKTGEPGS